MMAQHDGARCCLLTGACGGIGRATAALLKRRGYKVIGLDRLWGSETSKSDFAERLTVDLADKEAVVACLQSTEAAHGPVAALVNAAGWTPHADFITMPVEEYEQIVQINLMGALYLLRAALPGMIEQRTGRVVLVASDAARVGVRGEAVYAATKGAQISLMKSLAVELGRYGLTINVVSPGSTDTPMLRGMYTEEQIAKRAAANPLGRVGAPEDIASAIAFFLSEEASYITGQVLSVNGGMARVG